jgi:hypothetical protein
MLKVLYDAASNAVDASHQNRTTGDEYLFNDDDDESLATLAFTRNDTFASLDMNGQCNPSTITWATLLRQMKDEMAAIDYPQVPAITATRKFDLNQPFSLVPDSFDKKNGSKRSLLIGCNYRNTDGAELKASHDDIRSMKVRIVLLPCMFLDMLLCLCSAASCMAFSGKWGIWSWVLIDRDHELSSISHILFCSFLFDIVLFRLSLLVSSLYPISSPLQDYIVNVHGFPETEDKMTILLDDDEHEHPTFINIAEAFKSLSEQSQPGDTVFIQFSGHGGRINDATIDSTVESYDEMLAPCDYATRGLFRDTLIFKTLLAPMRYGVTVTILIDCCDTGMTLDLPYSWSTRADRLDCIPKMTQNDDFSFVRFLKVVKTLYESSTFTQLGKTVGSALGHQPTTTQQGYDGDDADTAGELTGTFREGVDGPRTIRSSLSGPLFLSLCGPPPRKNDDGIKSKDGGGGGDGNNNSSNNKDALSMLEHVFGCNFLVNEVDEALSDEETYANNTFDELTLQNSTFDSVEEFKRHNRGRSRRNRRT